MQIPVRHTKPVSRKATWFNERSECLRSTAQRLCISAQALSPGAVRPAGAVQIVYPAARVADLIVTLSAARLQTRVLQFIYNRADSEATLVLCEARKGNARGVEVRRPIVMFAQAGEYTAEMKLLLREPR